MCLAWGNFRKIVYRPFGLISLYRLRVYLIVLFREIALPWLPIYISKDDLTLISSWLSADEDISLITSTGAGKWKATHHFEISKTGKYCLYHRGCGPLPLLSKTKNEADSLILDPFNGWKELRSGADSDLPYFGPGVPSLFWFNVRLDENNTIGLSSFEWIGDHYSIIGNSAPVLSKKWWGKLKRWTKKHADKIPRGGLDEQKKSEIWTFKFALEEIELGTACAINP